MFLIEMKNARQLNPCRQCGRLTYNGKNKLCNGCDPNWTKPEFVRVGPDQQKGKRKIKTFKMNKREGKQIFHISECKNKVVQNMEFDLGESLIISFSDNTYIEFSGDNQGNGGYISVNLTHEERRRRERLYVFGYECNNCRHRWIPKKLTEKPKQCPKCRRFKITSIESKSYLTDPID